MRELSEVTLIGVDCLDVERLLRAAAICQQRMRFGAVRMLSSLPHTLSSVVRIDPITSINELTLRRVGKRRVLEGFQPSKPPTFTPLRKVSNEYSTFVTKQLNRYVETPFALIIQYDSFILNPDAWQDDFLAYDYIGAPWWVDGHHIVGNGGFSMRSKRLLTLLQEDAAIQVPPDAAEDWYICVTLRDVLEQRGIRFAPIALAKQFALEGNKQDGVTWTDQFGFHGLTWTDISLWLRQHPSIAIDTTLDSATLALKAQRA